jgi:hypothetical protein
VLTSSSFRVILSLLSIEFLDGDAEELGQPFDDVPAERVDPTGLEPVQCVFGRPHLLCELSERETPLLP